MCPLWFTGVSYSCVVHTQPVPPAQGKACRRWRAAKGCNECGAERHLWSRGPDTNPRMTIVILHSPAVSLWNDKIRRKIIKKCILNCTLLSLTEESVQIIVSMSRNWTLVWHVTSGDTHHSTEEELQQPKLNFFYWSEIARQPIWRASLFLPEKRCGLIELGKIWLDMGVWRPGEPLCRVSLMLAIGGSSFKRG